MDKQYLIEHILTLMDFLQKNGLALENLTAPDKQMEQFLADSSPDIRNAVEIIRFMDEIPGGFLIYFANDSEEIVYANQGLLRIFQCGSMQEFRAWTGNSFRGLVHPDDLEQVEESIYEQIAQSQYDLDYVEYRITRRDGVIRWIEDYGHFVRCGGAGNVFYVFIGDATEKHERIQGTLRSAKQQSEEEMRSLIETYDKERALINQEYLRQLEVIQGLSINYESIIYVDLDTDTVQSYRHSERTAGFPISGDKPSFSRYAAAYVDKWVFREDQQLAMDALKPDNIRLRLANCDTYYVNYRAANNGKLEYLQARIAKASGSISRIIIGCRKVDDEIRQEMEQRQLLSEALENANLAIVAKNTFLSNMSHDMRTPLNGILGYLTLAKKNLHNTGALLEYLEGAEASGHQMLSLIDEVLQIAWNDSNETKSKETKCDLCAMGKEVYDFLLPQAQEKAIDLKLETRITHSAVYAKAHKLKQMTLYLAGNAITYTNPGGGVSVILSERPGLSDQYAVYQLEVADTGIGMSAEFLQHLYEPFTRERNTTHSGVHGSGLGLTIVKKIVDRLGGSIDVKSRIDEGTTFTVTFRLRVQEEAVKPPAAKAPFKLGGQKILLVDDNEINLKIESKIFAHLGFSIETAVDGSEAVEKIKNAQPGDYDLILMDLQMPIMDGWQAAREIRALDNPALSNVPIIALSANVFPGDIRKSMESGMDAHLGKPIDVPALVSKVSDVLQRREALSQ